MSKLNDLKEKIKSQLNLPDVIERETGIRPTSDNGRYAAYPCPLHHEQNGQSFVIYEDHFTCFGKCQLTGDLIRFFELHKLMSFRDAVYYLADNYLGVSTYMQGSKPIQQDTRQAMSEPPPHDWQAKARQVLEDAHKHLLSDNGIKARAYLHKRGLTDEIIEAAMLGYVPGHFEQWQQQHGLNIPCGITIPWLANGAVWGLKVRRAAGKIKYQQVKGGNIKGALYLADYIQTDKSVIVTEGEFDALIALQIGLPYYTALALGSASNTRIDKRWYRDLAKVRTIYALMDNDSAGAKSAAKLAALTAAAKPLVLPQEFKDLNEMYLAWGKDKTQAWLDERVY